jgi:hypothetical protein
VPSHVTEPPGVAAELSGAEPGAQAEPQGAEPLDWAVIASQLGEFLAALHQPAPADAPVNLVRGVPLARRTATLEANLEILSGEADAGRVDVAAIGRLWAGARLGAGPGRGVPRPLSR